MRGDFSRLCKTAYVLLLSSYYFRCCDYIFSWTAYHFGRAVDVGAVAVEVIQWAAYLVAVAVEVAYWAVDAAGRAAEVAGAGP